VRIKESFRKWFYPEEENSGFYLQLFDMKRAKKSRADSGFT